MSLSMCKLVILQIQVVTFQCKHIFI